ncbi:amidohydrolase [soil metagenome]
MRILLVLLTIIFISCNHKQSADLIIFNAKIYTVDSNFSIASAMAIKDGKILETGTAGELLTKYNAIEKIDAQEKFIYPGFIDAHAHFLGYGQSLFQVDLYGVKSWDEAIQRVKTFAAAHPDEPWIRGRGWDQNTWAGKAFPNNNKLNELFPDKPVLLTRVDGHAAVANNKALEIAAITSGQTLSGGSIETINGRLTGILIDNAVDLVTSKFPANTKSEYEKWFTAAQKNCFAVGLTTIADCGLMYNDVEMIDALQREGKLKMMLYVMLSDDTANYNRYLNKGPYKTDKLFVKGIKVYADGALGSRGACLLQPYNDKPGWSGFLLKDKKYFDSLAHVIIKTDFQMCTHAIGDSANRVMLQIYNDVLQNKNDKRWRIEHAQVVNAADFFLFGKTSVVPSVQPTHATSDMYWAAERLGSERIKGAYAYKQLLQQNGWLPLGTDFPVEDISPFKTFLATVIRKDAKGFPAAGFQVENALTREQAIRGMTIWAARACFLENEIGSLEKNKKANFIILDKNLLDADEKNILNIRVLKTFVMGEDVFHQ